MVVNIAAFTSCYTVCDFCWFMIAYLRNQAQYSAHILFTNDLGPWRYLNYDCGAWNGESESFLNQHMRICVPAISCMHVRVGDGMVFVVSSCFTFFGVASAQPFCRAKNLSSRSFKQRTREKWRIMRQRVVGNPGHKHVSNFRTFVQVGICPCAHAVVLTCFNW